MKVFVSYSTKDLKTVERIEQLLKHDGIEVFVAESSVKAGENLLESIKQAICSCNVMILLWSSNSRASDWIPQEIGIAEGNNKTIIPIVLDEASAPPAFLAQRKYIRANDNLDHALQQLKEALLGRIVQHPQMSIGGALLIGALAGFIVASIVSSE